MAACALRSGIAIDEDRRTSGTRLVWALLLGAAACQSEAPEPVPPPEAPPPPAPLTAPVPQAESTPAEDPLPPAYRWVNAEDLRRIKGAALYRPVPAESPPPGTVEEVAPQEAPAGARTLVTVRASDPTRARLAIVEKNADGTLPALDAHGAFPSSARAAWIDRQPFLFGGAIFDPTEGFVLYVRLTLGATLAVSADGHTEKVAFLGSEVLIARRVSSAPGKNASATWSDPFVIARTRMNAEAAPADAAPIEETGLALWPYAVKREQRANGPGGPAAVSIFLVWDRLIHPGYLGTDRHPGDGIYRVDMFWPARSVPRMRGVPEKVADFSFEGVKTLKP